MRFFLLAMLAALGLAGCVPVYGPDYPAPMEAPVAVAAAPAPLSPRAAASNFIRVVSRVEPMTEEICRSRTRGVNCDFQIVIDDRPGQGPNAFQTVDGSGRPILGFTLALIADARNEDEIAFVLGHEAAHHILGHIPQTQQTAMAGAMMAGILAQATGADPRAVESAQRIGASVGARRYSRAFELEADALGAEPVMDGLGLDHQPERRLPLGPRRGDRARCLRLRDRAACGRFALSALRPVPLLRRGVAEPVPQHAFLRQCDALPAHSGCFP